MGMLYEIPPGWRWPVFILSSDGETILRPSSGTSRVRLSEFEVSGVNREESVRTLCEKLKSLCLFAGFAGTALVAVRADFMITEPVKVHILHVGVMFTGKTLYRDLERASDSMPVIVDMGEEEKRLCDAVVVQEVMDL